MKTDPLKRPKLHDAEKQEPYAGYYYHNSAQVPAPVIDEIKKSPYPCEHALLFNNINDLLNPEYLPLENGYCHMDDGGVFVAVLTQMPKVTGEMLDWWFWWHPMNSLRYRIWFPQAHFAATLDADPDEYRNRTGPYCRRYWHTTNYPVEDIGTGKEKLSITFVPPSDFGFDESRFDNAGVATAICGKVGSVNKKLRHHTDMCHFVRRKRSGVEMRSRFWIGNNIIVSGVSEKSILNRIINKKTVKTLLLPKNVGLAMAMHCAQEYHNLAEMLPEIYDKYAET